MVFGEVQAGEITEFILGKPVVGQSRLNLVLKISQVNRLTKRFRLGNPFSILLGPSDTFVLRTGASELPSVSKVLGLSAHAEIALTVVKRIAVYVINNFSILSISQHAVKVQALRAQSILNIFEKNCTRNVATALIPVPLREPLKVFCVHEGELPVAESKVGGAIMILHSMLQTLSAIPGALPRCPVFAFAPQLYTIVTQSA